MDRSYKTNAPSVVSEIIDGEAVIMNLKTGNYFSTLGVGSRVWSWVDAGHSVAAITAAVTSEYDVEQSAAASAIDAFVTDLLANDLIVEAGGAASVMLASARPATRAAFTAPVLNVYSDMQDLLLLDPIHDVDDAGWPQQKLPGAP